MIIDGIGCSSAIDKSGERLLIEGLDISSVPDGTVYLNFEHKSGAEGGALDIVGKVIHAHKVLSLSDCKNDRERELWRGLELPFCYVICRIDDEAGHAAGAALAATIRSELKNEGKVTIGLSVEGSTIKRDGNDLVETVARAWAITCRPCNLSSIISIVSDPAAPPGFEKEPAKDAEDILAGISAKKSEEILPSGLFRLGGHERVYSNPVIEESELAKAISAGSYGGAPGTLTQGAALQVEDQSLHRAHLKNQSRAALRDWNEKAEPDFRKYLAGKLPDASDVYLDRFADLVEDYRIKKAQANPADPDLFQPMEKTDPKWVEEDDAPADEAEPGEDADTPAGPLTIRGKPVTVPNVGRHAQFDAQSGTLHTQRGSFQMHIPGRDQDPRGREGFANALQDRGPNEIHSRAMKQWRRAHELLKAGRLPDAIVMHAALHGLMSANTAVPIQELMYAHAVDEMNQSGIDPRNPRWKQRAQSYLDRDKPNQYPQHSRDHFLAIDHMLRVKDTDVGLRAYLNGKADRRPGDIMAFQLPGGNGGTGGKFDYSAKYHRVHNKLVELLQHHGHDAQAAVEDMMTHKAENKLWDARRKKEMAAGMPDRGEFPGMQVPGMAPKIARYMMGMLGGGNVVVPDTHFVRHLFGLEKGVDTPSIDYLKGVISRPGNSHILNSIDQYYQQNHDAMNHVRRMPELQGVDDRDLVFPAFWRHWMAIVPHEESRGMNTLGYNEAVDHMPFWDAIKRYLDEAEGNGLKVVKHDQDAMHVALDAVNQHRDWEEKLGEAPAHLLYWALLAPKLLGNAEVETMGPDANGEVDRVGKFERLAVNLAIVVEELRKRVDEVEADKPPETVTFAGKRVKPGKVSMYKGDLPEGPQFHIIGQDSKNFFVVPHGNFKWQPNEVSKLSKLGHGVGYKVDRWPEEVGTDKVVNASVHGHKLNRTPEQVKLIHGLDVGKRKLDNKAHEQEPGFGDATREWRRGPTGIVITKADRNVGDFPTARAEVAFYNAARDVFGLHKYLPVTAMMKHPVTGQETAVIEKLKGAYHEAPIPGSDLHTHLSDLHNRGELDKLGLMDYVLGNTDRTSTNAMMSPEGLKLIDHGYGFSKSQNPSSNLIPDYLSALHDMGATQKIHPDAARWIRGITPEKLAADLVKSGVPQERIEAALHRLSRVHDFWDVDANNLAWTDLVDQFGRQSKLA